METKIENPLEYVGMKERIDTKLVTEINGNIYTDNSSVWVSFFF